MGSSEPAGQPQRPGLFERAQSRYASTAGERTELNPGLSRSSSVRNSPVEPKWEDRDAGPFGARRVNPQPTRHRSASPKVRTAGSTADFSSSESSEDEVIHMASRKKAQPRPPKPRVATDDGFDTQASFKNYTRVVLGEATANSANGYVYPAPGQKQPTRTPFPNVTSPDDIPSDRTPFSNSSPKPDPVFREANFKHQDWADRLRSTGGSTSPSKKNARPRARTGPSATNSADQDVEMGDATPPSHRGETNGVGVDNLNDLKEAGPFGTSGLNGVDDLKNNLPFESKPAKDVNVDPAPRVKLTADHLPRPPRPVHAPPEDSLTQEAWSEYCKKMRAYMVEWRSFQRTMTEHFRARQDQYESCMHDDWISMRADGPQNDPGPGRGGYGTYMAMLKDDEVCHAWWEQAFENHDTCMRELGRLRNVVKGIDGSDVSSNQSG